MLKTHSVPEVRWTICSPDTMPDEGKFIWVVVGRMIECGAAKRYVREVHMGVYQGDRRFQIFPYRTPMCSHEVWAWAMMTPPVAPICTKKTSEYDTAEPESAEPEPEPEPEEPADDE